MFKCNKTITLIRHTEQRDGDSYDKTVITGVGYTEQSKLQQDGTTVTAADVLTVTIPQGKCSIIPIKDDYIVCGEIEDTPKSLKQIQSCSLPCYRVVSVNDYTGDILGHFEVIGT